MNVYFDIAFRALQDIRMENFIFALLIPIFKMSSMK